MITMTYKKKSLLFFSRGKNGIISSEVNVGLSEDNRPDLESQASTFTVRPSIDDSHFGAHLTHLLNEDANNNPIESLKRLN